MTVPGAPRSRLRASMSDQFCPIWPTRRRRVPNRCAKKPSAGERPGLGTEWGETRYSHVSHTSFDRADPNHPSQLVSLYYNDREGARAMARYADYREMGDAVVNVAGLAIRVALNDDSGRPLPAFFAGGPHLRDRRSRAALHGRRHQRVRREASKRWHRSMASTFSTANRRASASEATSFRRGLRRDRRLSPDVRSRRRFPIRLGARFLRRANGQRSQRGHRGRRHLHAAQCAGLALDPARGGATPHCGSLPRLVRLAAPSALVIARSSPR